jgi:hypothetical protein
MLFIMDSTTIPLATPKMFGDVKFAELNADLFNAYAEYRVKGYHSHVAFRRVFGEDYMDPVSHVRIEMIEHNEYHKARFNKRLKEIKTEELWDAKVALNELLSMARNPFAKDSTRLNAMRELNILVGIVIVDENGKTKAGRSLADFYQKPPTP